MTDYPERYQAETGAISNSDCNAIEEPCAEPLGVIEEAKGRQRRKMLCTCHSSPALMSKHKQKAKRLSYLGLSPSSLRHVRFVDDHDVVVHGGEENQQTGDEKTEAEEPGPGHCRRTQPARAANEFRSASGGWQTGLMYLERLPCPGNPSTMISCSTSTSPL